MFSGDNYKMEVIDMVLRVGKPEEVGMNPDKLKNIEDKAATWIEKGILHSLVFLVARKGIIVTQKAYGRLTGEPNSSPVQLDSLYPIASVTKPITATAAMLLVEDGLLTINRPVSQYIPEFKGEGKEAVCVHHLMTHTSGLTDDHVFPYIESRKGNVELPPMEETQHPNIYEWLTMGYDVPLSYKPGERMTYCDYGIQVLGEIIRRVSGKPLEVFAKERIFDPLGMKDTYYVLPRFERDRAAKHPDFGEFSGICTEDHMDTPSASGGIYSTVYDMAIFCQMFLNQGVYEGKRILSKSTVYQMKRNQISGTPAFWGNEYFEEASWGLCWDIHGFKRAASELWSPEAYSHEGYGGMVIWVDPKYETIGVYFSSVLKDNCKDVFNNAIIAAIEE